MTCDTSMHDITIPNLMFIQASRLGAGNVQHTFVWFDGSIVLQFKVELVVIAVLMEETANIGIMDEFMSTVSEKLRPFCISL